jgi:hypothetical protein
VRKEEEEERKKLEEKGELIPWRQTLEVNNNNNNNGMGREGNRRESQDPVADVPSGASLYDDQRMIVKGIEGNPRTLWLVFHREPY